MTEIPSELILYDGKFERIYTGFMRNDAHELEGKYHLDRYDNEMYSLKLTDTPDSSVYSFGSMISGASKVMLGKNKKFIVAYITPRALSSSYTSNRGYLFYTRREVDTPVWLRIEVPENFLDEQDIFLDRITIHLSDSDFLCVKYTHVSKKFSFYNLSDNTWHVFALPEDFPVGIRKICPLPGTDELLLILRENERAYAARYDLRQQKLVSDAQYIPGVELWAPVYSDENPIHCLPIRYNDDFFLIISDERSIYLYSLSTGSVETIHYNAKQILFDPITNILFSVTIAGADQIIRAGRCYLDRSIRKLGNMHSVAHVRCRYHLPYIFNMSPLIPGRCWLLSFFGKYSTYYRILLTQNERPGTSLSYSTVPLPDKIQPKGTAIYFLNNEMRGIVRDISTHTFRHGRPGRHVLLVDSEETFFHSIRMQLLSEDIQGEFKNRVLNAVRETNYSVQELTKGWKDTSAVFLDYDYASRLRLLKE